MNDEKCTPATRFYFVDEAGEPTLLNGGWHIVAERRHAEATIDPQAWFSMLTIGGENMPPVRCRV